MKVRIALADDHVLLRNGLANLLKDLDYEVVFEANNGKEFLEQLKLHPLPQVVLMDINMPVMDGFETTLWIKRIYPAILVLALSMYDDENAIIHMIKNGARGYILKDSAPAELKYAIQSVLAKGFYQSELVTGKLIHSINLMSDEEENSTKGMMPLTGQEIEFLKLACSDMTYKEVADYMHLSPRTIEDYQDQLFEKLGVKSRVGLVIYAIRNGIVNL
jgi:DNA-binding NarL/FixJ family response regulator